MALSLSAYYGKINLVKQFLKLYAYPDRRTTFKTPSGVIYPQPLYSSILSGNREIAKILIDYLIKMEIRQGVAPSEAHQSLQRDMPHTLFEYAVASSTVHEHIDYSKRDEEGYPLPDHEMLNFLLKQGFKPESRDLIATAENCTVDIMKLLIEYGAILDQETASKALLRLIDYSIASPTAMIFEYHIEMFGFLLEKEASINYIEVESMQTPLHTAINRNDAWVKLVLSKKPNLENVDGMGSTALHHAVLNGEIEMVKMLLVAGAEINALTEENLSALSFTCSNDDWILPEANNPALVKLLLSQGADPLLENQPEEARPLFLAKMNGFHEIVEILENHIQSQQSLK